jgi:hypothetical protein
MHTVSRDLGRLRLCKIEPGMAGGVSQRLTNQIAAI